MSAEKYVQNTSLLTTPKPCWDNVAKQENATVRVLEAKHLKLLLVCRLFCRPGFTRIETHLLLNSRLQPCSVQNDRIRSNDPVKALFTRMPSNLDGERLAKIFQDWLFWLISLLKSKPNAHRIQHDAHSSFRKCTAHRHSTKHANTLKTTQCSFQALNISILKETFRKCIAATCGKTCVLCSLHLTSLMPSESSLSQNIGHVVTTPFNPQNTQLCPRFNAAPSVCSSTKFTWKARLESAAPSVQRKERLQLRLACQG